MAATFYFSKSRQNNGLAGLTSRGGPKVHIVGGPHGPIDETHCQKSRFNTRYNFKEKIAFKYSLINKPKLDIGLFVDLAESTCSLPVLATPCETGDRWSKQYTFVILVEYDLNVIVKAIYGANFMSHGSILKKINF